MDTSVTTEGRWHKLIAFLSYQLYEANEACVETLKT